MKEITMKKKKKPRTEQADGKNTKFNHSDLPPLCQKLDQPSC